MFLDSTKLEQALFFKILSLFDRTMSYVVLNFAIVAAVFFGSYSLLFIPPIAAHVAYLQRNQAAYIADLSYIKYNMCRA